MASPSLTKLETHATDVALDLLPDERPKKDDLRSIDFITILNIVIAVIQTVIENCPQAPSEMAKSFKNPSRLQRAQVLKIAKDTCDCCGHNQQHRRRAGQMADMIVQRAAELDTEEAVQLVDEVRNVNLLSAGNLLI